MVENYQENRCLLQNPTTIVAVTFNMLEAIITLDRMQLSFIHDEIF